MKITEEDYFTRGKRDMTNWVKKDGYYVVEPTRVYSKEELQRNMELLEKKLEAAERYFAKREKHAV